MGETTFTPGPWEAVEVGPGWEGQRFAVVDANGDDINNEFREGFREADACLIAAAPDLYAALKAIYDADGYNSALAESAERALQKAEGRTDR